MRFSKTRIFLLSVLLALVTLWVNNQQVQKAVKPEHKILPSQSYSWQATDTTLWTISHNQPSKQTIIHANSIQYQDATKQSQFTQPNIKIISANNLTELSSKSGYSQNDNIITLQTGVMATQKTITKNIVNTVSPTTLSTERLHYNIQKNGLSTTEKVTIKQDSAQTSGIGLKADLTNTQYEILSAVKSTYQPKTNHTQSKGP